MKLTFLRLLLTRLVVSRVAVVANMETRTDVFLVRKVARGTPSRSGDGMFRGSDEAPG